MLPIIGLSARKRIMGGGDPWDVLTYKCEKSVCYVEIFLVGKDVFLETQTEGTKGLVVGGLVQQCPSVIHSPILD